MQIDLLYCLVAFLAAMLFGALFTGLVRRWQIAGQMGQTVREDGPESHLKKMGTPTLGGLGIMVALTLVTLPLWWFVRDGLGDSQWRAVPLILALALAYAAIGFADDWSKVRYKRPLGLKARVRVPLELILAVVFAVAMVRLGALDPNTNAQLLPLGTGVLFVLVAVFVILGGGNAVNLTDGLDGLAGGVSCFCALAISVACLFHHQLHLALFAAGLAGVCAGFLWLNCHPASIFMGDVGSLGLGAALAGLAIAARMEILLGLFGIVFVIEALSVIIQVLYFKYSGGKRVFRMAPFHHHLELGGMAETKIVLRFWLITIAAGTVGVMIVTLLNAHGRS